MRSTDLSAAIGGATRPDAMHQRPPLRGNLFLLTKVPIKTRTTGVTRQLRRHRGASQQRRWVHSYFSTRHAAQWKV
eukprot:6259582-Pyramimonas_sp.AAC.1